MKIIFWDIDGTLIRTSKAGLFAFAEAFRQIWQAEADFTAIKAAGMTDSYIAAQLIEQLTGRQAAKTEITNLVACYEKLLPAHLARRHGEILPAVQPALEYCRVNTEIVSLLLTGNTRTGAQVKLDYFQLSTYFDFNYSAFDNHCLNRLTIADTAKKQAVTFNANLSVSDIYIIGDTPNDIHCGRSVGIRTIAVATGSHTLAELISHKPWQAYAQLPSPSEFAKLLELA